VAAVSDETTKREPAVVDSAVPELPDTTTADASAPPEAAPEASATPDQPSGIRTVVGRGCGIFLLLIVAAAAGMAGLISLGTWVAEHKTSSVPSVSGLRVPDATSRILAADLSIAPMGAFATSTFESDVVMQQSPEFATSVAPGTPIDLLVAVSPTPTVVPDVSLDENLVATSKLEHALLAPVVYQQLSDTVPFGRVVAQMPRAGERVMTGQQVALFVSLGRGVGGAVVPSVLGKTVPEAATEVASVYLVAILFDPRAGSSLDGKVTDQVPAPGTRVPIGSAVPLITSGSAN
jgi:beta-lactam-binding protein with PASTA domain